MSWLWGLGFFYTFHLTVLYGWLAFISFASVNAGGLFLFGWTLDRLPQGPAACLPLLGSRFGGTLLLFQVAACAITVFGFAACFVAPAGLDVPAALALLVLCASAAGHAFRLPGLRRFHTVLLVCGAATALFAATRLGAGAVAAGQGPDARFAGLVLPAIVGFALGPWLDVQQWHRAAAIKAEGRSVTVAYGGGALLFFALLTLNAALAAGVGAAGAIVAPDGLPDGAGAVARAIARSGDTPALAAFGLWAFVAMLTTLDSAYAALRWFLEGALARSESPLLAFVPSRLVASPIWVLAAGLALGCAAFRFGMPLTYLVIPFATVFVGSGASLVCAVLGAQRPYDAVLCLLLGCVAALVFVFGYLPPVPALMALAPLIGLIGALPAAVELVRGASALPAEPAPREGSSTVGTASEPGDRLPAMVPAGAPANEAVRVAHGFEGDWFVMPLVPTYDDTNSVGNVYFANYVRWVGKARELFFDACMPGFDLKTTSYFILTRSFTHDFRREAREFEPVQVRLRIARHNRKFVTLVHEIVSPEHGILGSGEQALMFVDVTTSKPLDIPAAIIRGFLPHWPKESRFAQGRAA